MSGGFFRGTSADQDTRFSNKQAKLMKSQKFPPELEHLVDMTKVEMNVVRPWIANRVTELLGFEDEVLINFIYGLLDGKEVNGKEVQISLTGFMEKNTGKFMKELWTLLLSAQKNASGVPQQLLDAKGEEIKKKQAEQDRIANEIQKKKEKESREFEQERLRKTDGEVETRATNADLEPTSKQMLPKTSSARSEDEREAGERNGLRGRNRVSRSPHSADHSPSSPRGSRSRSISKSLSNSRSYSNGRHRSRSASRSPEARGRSISPRRRSVTPRRRNSSRVSPSPSRWKSSYFRRRSRSHSPRRSPSPVRRRFRSPFRRRSPSPVLRRRSPSPARRRRSPSPVRRRRSPSPLRRRSPPPIRRRSPPPLRRRSPSPVRRRSPLPVHRRSPLPFRRRSPSPFRRRSPSPVRRRSPPAQRRSPTPMRRRRQRSPSTPQRRSPSPIRHRSPIPGRRRSPTPSLHRSPSAYESSSPSVQHRSPSPVRSKSIKDRRRSPVRSSRERIRPSISLRSPQRDPQDRKDLRNKEPSLSPSLEKSPILVQSPALARKRSASEDRRSFSPYESPARQTRERMTRDGVSSPPRKPREQKPRDVSPEISKEEEENDRAREDGDHKTKSSQKRSLLPSTVNKQKDSPMKVHYREDHSPDRIAGRRATDSRNRLDDVESRKKDQEIKSEKNSGRGAYSETPDQQRSPTIIGDRQRALYSGEGQKSDERNRSHSNNVKERDGHNKSETVPMSVEKVDHNNRSGTVDSGSEESGKRKSEGREKRKHKRSDRREVASDDDYSYDSEIEEKKEAKRRRKEEKKLKKEEKRRRREERRRKREERRAEKLRVKNQYDASASDGEHVPRKVSHPSDDEEAATEQKKLEIELRKKALESLKAKKGISH